ncbi:unnamed protein product [Choristocarpus tenellus]
MEDSGRISSVENALGYRFRKRDFILNALTHSSFCNEELFAGGHMDELEWLGDSVLQLAVSSWLFHSSSARERSSGHLSIVRQRFVSASACAAFADRLNLRPFIRHGQGQLLEGTKILGDCFEAVLGAVYLDSGSMEPVHNILQKVIPSFTPTKKISAGEVVEPRQLMNLCHRLVQMSRGKIGTQNTHVSSGEGRMGHMVQRSTSKLDPQQVVHQFNALVHAFQKSVLREGLLSCVSPAFEMCFGLDAAQYIGSILANGEDNAHLDEVMSGEATCQQHFPYAPPAVERVFMEGVCVPKDRRLSWCTVIEFLADNLLKEGESEHRAVQLILSVPQGAQSLHMLCTIIRQSAHNVLFNSYQRHNFASILHRLIY